MLNEKINSKKSSSLNVTLSTLIKISLLSVIAFLIQFIEVPLAIFPDFLKLDISDLPALIGAFALGPVAGVAIELLKNILHGLTTKTAFIGELANFLVGGIYVFIAGYIYKKKKDRVGALIGLGVGVIAMTIGATILNYYVFLPLYDTVLHFPISAIVKMGTKVNPMITDLKTFVLLSIAPFNLIKGIFLAAITFLVYKKVSYLINKQA